MPRRNNPFGPRNRSLPRSLRKELSKKNLKTVNVSEPSEAPYRRYKSKLDSFMSPVKKETEEWLSGISGKYAGKSDRFSVLSFVGEFLSGLFSIREKGVSPEKEKAIREAATTFTSEVNNDQKSKFKKNTSSIGFQYVDSPMGEKNVESELATSVFENVSLIKSLETKYLNDIQKMVFAQIGINLPEPETEIPGKKNKKLSKKAINQPTPVEVPQILNISDLVTDIISLEEKVGLAPIQSKTMIEKIMEINGNNRTSAERIARDQTQKVFSSLEEARGRDAGFQWYVWSGSNDNRERESHKANNNKIFHIDFPPEETGPPGRDINCRCRRKWLVSKSQIINIRESDLGYSKGYKRRGAVIEKLNQAKSA